MMTVSFTFVSLCLLVLTVSCQTPAPSGSEYTSIIMPEPTPIESNESIPLSEPESSVVTATAVEEPIVEPVIPDEPTQTAEIEDEPIVDDPVIETEIPPEPVTETFDPSTITKEIFDSTKTDVQELINRLNGIIREKKFDEWILFLGTEYRQVLSEPGFLARISASAVLKKQGITLRDIRDYFIYVVVPSRAKDRVDDIAFIGQNRVKAFTIDAKGRKLRLYDLEKTTNGWKIVD